MREKCGEDVEIDNSGETAYLRYLVAESEKKESAALKSMLWALHLAMLSVISLAMTGSWKLLSATVGLIVLMGIGTDYYCDRGMWSFSFFKDSLNCLVSGWKARLRPKSANE